MENLGRIPVKVNGIVAPCVKSFDSDATQTQKLHNFADGTGGRSEGRKNFKFNIQSALMTVKQELLALIEQAKASGNGVNITYQLGDDEYLLINCGIDTEKVSSDSDGSADLTISGVAPDRLKTR